MPKTVWKDDFLYEAHDLARTGLSEPKIASALGVSLAILRKWKQKRPAFARALRKGREAVEDDTRQTFADYVYGRLTPELQERWDSINACDYLKNGYLRVQELMAECGKNARQHLFLHALICSNFNASEARRKLGLNKKTVESWLNDLQFHALVDEIHEAKKDFFESALMRNVRDGDPSTVIFVNRTYNRDRGYNDKVDVNIEKNVTHQHSHVVQIQVERLPLDVRKGMLKAIREQQQEAIDVQSRPVDEEDTDAET